MPVRMVEMKRAGRSIGFRVVDTGGKVAASFTIGRTIAGKSIKSLKDARDRARAFVQARNLGERRAAGKSAPPAPRRNR